MDRSQGLDLRDYWAILRRRWAWVVLFVVLTVAAAMAVTYRQTPIYQASAEVLVEPLGSASQQSMLERALLGRADLATQQQVVKSVAMAERVEERLQLDVDPRRLLERIEVTVIRDTSVMQISADHADPDLAASLAQTFSEVYLDFRRERATEQLGAATADLTEQADQTRDRIDAIDQELAAIDTQGEADTETASPGTVVTREASLQRERDTLLTQLGQLTAQLSSLTADNAVGGGGEVIVPAEVPSEPVSPDPVRNAGLALVLGLVLGLGVAFAVDQLDDAIRSDHEVRRAIGKPVVGHIAHWKDAKRTNRLVTINDPWSPPAEAYRTLRTNVRFLARPAAGDRSGRGPTIVVTSATSGEGKTTTAANLAVASASAGTKTLLVDADLRRPDLHRLFGMSEVNGFAELLVDAVDLQDAVMDVGILNLRIIPCGHVPPNPAELLASANTQRLMSTFQELADLVIFDSAPVLAVADTLELAPSATATLLVVDAGHSHRRSLRAAADRLQGVGTEAAGVVMNNIEAGTSYYGYYYDHYQRYEPDTTSQAPVKEPSEATSVRGNGERPKVFSKATPPPSDRPARQPPAAPAGSGQPAPQPPAARAGSGQPAPQPPAARTERRPADVPDSGAPDVPHEAGDEREERPEREKRPEREEQPDVRRGPPYERGRQPEGPRFGPS